MRIHRAHRWLALDQRGLAGFAARTGFANPVQARIIAVNRKILIAGADRGHRRHLLHCR